MVSTAMPSAGLLELKVTARIPTLAGEFQLYLYAGSGDGKEHLAMVMGDVRGKIGRAGAHPLGMFYRRGAGIKPL